MIISIIYIIRSGLQYLEIFDKGYRKGGIECYNQINREYIGKPVCFETNLGLYRIYYVRCYY